MVKEIIRRLSYSLKTDPSGTFKFVYQARGRKYGVEFEGGYEIVNEPENPQYLRDTKRAVEDLEKSGETLGKFSIVGIANPTEASNDPDKPLRIEVVFPGLLNIVMPFTILEPEKIGRVGVRINCLIKKID